MIPEECPQSVHAANVAICFSDQTFGQVLDSARDVVATALHLIQGNDRSIFTAGPDRLFNRTAAGFTTVSSQLR